MLYKYNVLRAERPMNVPLLMTVIWLLDKSKVCRAARPLKAPLLMEVILLVSKFL